MATRAAAALTRALAAPARGLDAGALGIGLDALRLEAIQPPMEVLLALVQGAEDLAELRPVAGDDPPGRDAASPRASRAPRRRTRSSSSAASSARAARLERPELRRIGLEQRALGASLLGERLQPERQGLRLLAEPVDLGAEVALR